MKTITVQATSQLWDVEAATVDECIVRVQERMQAFIECGQALRALRDRKLYKEKGYSTFEELCEKEFGFGRQRGVQLMEAAAYALSLPEAERPKTERAARTILHPPKPKKEPTGPLAHAADPFVPIAEEEDLTNKYLVRFDRATWLRVDEMLHGDVVSNIQYIVKRHLDMLTRNQAFTQREVYSVSKEKQSGRKR